MATHRDDGAIRHRVLTGLARNRTPGFHFIGNFLGLSFDERSRRRARISIPHGPQLEEADGQANFGIVALLADLALAASIRARLDPATRLATVSMHLQLTGVPLAGDLDATGWFEGFLEGSKGRQGLARFALNAGGRKAMFGSGAFMALDPPPGVRLRAVSNPGTRKVAPADEATLDDREREVLRRADVALSKASKHHSFIRRFLGHDPVALKDGAACTMPLGDHVANRVGHLQGGLTVGLAATTAMAALPETWRLSGISSWFTSPGEGEALEARARFVHHGRLTAVVRTEVTGSGGRRVLEAITTHHFAG